MDSGRFEAVLLEALGRWGLSIDARQLESMRTHFERMVEANRDINLTRITEPTAAAVRHYADSLALLPLCRDRGLDIRTVLDVGTGAGFPSLPLAVMRPDWVVLAIDATGKKVQFLKSVAAELKLENLTIEHAHSVHWQSGRRFDLVVFRALARLDRALRQCSSLIGRQGRLVAYQTAATGETEVAETARAAKAVRLEVVEHFLYDLLAPDGHLRRELTVLAPRRGG